MALNVTPTPSAGKAKTSTTSPVSSGVRSSSPALSSLFSGVTGTPVSGTDFVTLAPPPPRCIGLLYGRDKHGKSTFLTDFCPQPVYNINLDNRGEEAAYRAATELGRLVHYLPTAFPADILSMDHEDAKQYGREILDRLVRNYNAAAEMMRGKGGTLGLDTVTELADLVKLAVRGRVDRPAGTKEDKGDFGKSDALINRQLWHFPNKARECRVNLIMIARATEIYQDREATGRFTYKCDKVFSSACDWAMEIRKAGVQEQEARFVAENGGKPLSTSQALKIRQQGPQFELEVALGGMAIAEEGKVYTEVEWGEDGPFAYACSRLIPRTTVEDWK